MYCPHLRFGQPATDWVAGRVTQADFRMVAVQFETDVYTSNGWPAPGRVLWCTHGSRHLRRPAPPADSGPVTPTNGAAFPPVEDS